MQVLAMSVSIVLSVQQQINDDKANISLTGRSKGHIVQKFNFSKLKNKNFDLKKWD